VTRNKEQESADWVKQTAARGELGRNRNREREEAGARLLHGRRELAQHPRWVHVQPRLAGVRAAVAMEDGVELGARERRQQEVLPVVARAVL